MDCQGSKCGGTAACKEGKRDGEERPRNNFKEGKYHFKALNSVNPHNTETRSLVVNSKPCIDILE